MGPQENQKFDWLVTKNGLVTQHFGKTQGEINLVVADMAPGAVSFSCVRLSASDSLAERHGVERVEKMESQSER